MGLKEYLARNDPLLKKRLRMARIMKTPEEVIGNSLKNALMMGGCLAILIFFFLDKNGGPVILVPLIFIVLSFLFYKFNMLKIQAQIMKRQKEIDKDVLFAGRYLLVKLNSGQPLLNAIVDASKSFGIANKYFKEIVKEIELGKPLEKALADEAEYSPSARFRKILFQISNALKIGIDVTEFLQATLDEIADEQLIEINRYGKKLNSITLFYMLFAVVMPSLGLTIFIVVASLAAIPIDMSFFGVILFFLAILQIMFMMIFRAARPTINL